MDPGSTLLSADYGASTTGDLSKKFELLESNSQSSNCKSMRSISIANLIGAAVAGLKPMETKLQNVKGNSCQIISIFESDEYDSDEILSLDGLPENEEEIPLELEISLLSDDSKGPLLENDMRPSISANLVTPDLYSSTLEVSPPPTASSNLDPNNNFSHKKQTLTGSDNGTFFLEDKTKSEQKVYKGVNPNRQVVKESQEFSCADPSNKIFVESYSTRTNINGYSDTMQNGATLHGNILETTSKSDECDFFKDSTIDKKCAWSESLHKSKLKSIDFSKCLFPEISTILKDCNDNVLDLEFGKDILSLEPSDVKKCVETTSNSTKTNLHNTQAGLKTQSKENSQQDPCSDQSLSESCIASQSQYKSGLNPQLDLIEENVQLTQKNSSPSCPCFVPAQDFKTKPTGKKNDQSLLTNLIVITTLEGDRINVLSDKTYTSFQQNHDRYSMEVSPGVKSQPTNKKVLKQSPQNFINTKSVKCSSQSEDSVIVKDLKDLSKINKPTVSTPKEKSLEHSGNFGVTKSYSLDVKEYSLEQSVINDEKSLTNFCELPKIKDSNPEQTALTCQDLMFSPNDSQLTDYQKKSIQIAPLSMQKPLKSNFQGQSSQDDNQFRSSNYKALTSGHASLNSSMSRQHLVENCTKDKTEEIKVSLKSISESSCAKTVKKMEEEPLLHISVNSDYDNQKRIVKLGNQLERDEVLAYPSNWQVSKSLNEDNQSVTEKNKYDQELKMTIQNSYTPCITNKYFLKNIVLPKDVSKNSNNNGKSINTDSIPTKCSTQTYNTTISKPIPNTAKNNATTILNGGTVSASVAHSQLADRKTFKKNKKQIPQKTPVQPNKVSKGVKKKKKSKSANKRAKALLALSEARNLSAQALVETAYAQRVSTKCSIQANNTATSKAIPNITSSHSSLQQQTCTKDVTVMAEDPISKRKFVKAKRVWDKQKQLCSLLDGEDCLDECKINDRVQWVRQRWKVKTLSNQDLNLTTAAYIRRQLPIQTAACFQGCLEGQKDYTLAIVAPNRKRKLYQDDDDSTEASDSLVRATKKRRLSQDVQLMPNDIKDLQPHMKLERQLMEKLSADHSMSLRSLKRQRDEELNMLNEQYQYLKYNLQQKYFQDQLFYGFRSMYQIQCDYRYQHQQLNLVLQSKQDHVIRSFAEEKERIRTQYKMEVEKIKTVLSDDASDSSCLTVSLRKGPSRMSNYKITYQNVNLTSHVAQAIMREDEIYDSFYNHKV